MRARGGGEGAPEDNNLSGAVVAHLRVNEEEDEEEEEASFSFTPPL